MTRSGFVGLAGRPNVGKSTLVNAIVGSHVAIVSVRPQTTRRAIRGVATDLEAERQLILVDLPGVQRPRDVLTERMQKRVERELADSDVALVVINGEEGVGPGDRFIVRAAARRRRRAAGDLRRQQGRPARARTSWSRCSPRPPSWRASTRSSRSAPAPARGSTSLLERLGELMPEGPYMYPPEDQQRPVERAAAGRADPRAGAEPDPRRRSRTRSRSRSRRSSAARGRPGHRQAEIWAETESQKGILIGKGGAKIGEIGTAARRSLEARARAPRSTSTSASACAATGAATRTCSTGSASSSGAAVYDGPMFGEIEFDQRGLAPCVVQDFATGEVLMLAY